MQSLRVAVTVPLLDHRIGTAVTVGVSLPVTPSIRLVL